MINEWSNADLVKDFDTLRELESKTSDPILKYKIEEAMDHVKGIIKERCHEKGNYSLRKILEYCIEDYEKNKAFLDLIENFAIINQESYKKAQVLSVPNRKITNDEYFSLIHDFYKCFGDEWFNLFLKEFNYKSSRFRFEKPFGEKEACTYFVPILKKAYIEASNEKSIESISSTVHEYRHAIGAHLNQDRFVKNEDITLEVESIFFELIADDYFEAVLQDEHFNILRNNRILTYTEISLDLIDNCMIVKKWLDVNKVSINELKKKLNVNEQMALSNVKRGYDSRDDYIYAISINIALELYFMFQDDQELTLDYLKKIILNKFNGISLVRNDLDYYKKMNEYNKDVLYNTRVLKRD